MYQYCAHTRLLSINPYFVNNLCNLADNNVQKLQNCSSTCPLLACIVSLHSGNSLMSYAQTSNPLGTPFGRPIVSGIHYCLGCISSTTEHQTKIFGTVFNYVQTKWMQKKRSHFIKTYTRCVGVHVWEVCGCGCLYACAHLPHKPNNFERLSSI